MLLVPLVKSCRQKRQQLQVRAPFYPSSTCGQRAENAGPTMWKDCFAAWCVHMIQVEACDDRQAGQEFGVLEAKSHQIGSSDSEHCEGGNDVSKGSSQPIHSSISGLSFKLGLTSFQRVLMIGWVGGRWPGKLSFYPPPLPFLKSGLPAPHH